ncbi:hypothetical protein BD414DRAFT_500572 [Trametes punicea]|nr:hypothetical protein BD414DRAFT_500572 [Trametes punicea]
MADFSNAIRVPRSLVFFHPQDKLPTRIALDSPSRLLIRNLGSDRTSLVASTDAVGGVQSSNPVASRIASLG